MSDEKKLLIEAYELIQMEGRTRASIAGEPQDKEFIHNQKLLSDLEDLGYVDIIAKASGFWEFTITQSGIAAVRLNAIQ